MDLRKVQKTGGSTFIVSLPKEWATEHGIEAGDSLALIRQQDGSISVSPRGETATEDRERTIEAGDRALDRVAREFIASYLAGYDSVQVAAPDRLGTDVRDGIRDLTRKVIGPEIVDESGADLVVEDLLDPAHLPIRKGVRRMYFITRSMHLDAMEAVETGDEDLAQDVVSRDDDVDRLFWMVSKQYNLVLRDVREGEKVGVTPGAGLDYVLVARALERVADHAARIAESGLEVDRSAIESLLDELEASSETAVDVLEESFDAFYGSDMEQANAAIARAEPLERRYEDLLEQGVQLAGRDAVHFAYILESLFRTGSYATDIAEVAINHAVREDPEAEDDG
jgi:phosphate uptake regulator